MGAPTRKDAQRSRRAILDAAEELIADHPDVSYAEIAHRAKVGQATVYRHFPTRQALHAAHGEESIKRMAAGAAATPIGPDSFEQLLRTFVAEQVRFQGLAAAIRRGEVEEERVERIEIQARELFSAPLAAAKDAGRVRADLSDDDALLILAMVDGSLGGLTDRVQREGAAARTLELIFDGLR